MSVALVISIYVMWALLLIIGLAVLALYRHFGQMYINSSDGKARQGPDIGSALLSIARQDITGAEVALPTTRPTLILFVDTTCEMCAVVREQLNALGAYADKLETVIFCSGLLSDVRAWASRTPGYVRVVHDKRSAAAHHYKVNGTPFAVAVGPEGAVQGKDVVNSGSDLIQVVEQALSQPTQQDMRSATEEVIHT